MSQPAGARVELKCGCVYTTLGHYFVSECDRHTKQREAARAKRKAKAAARKTK